MNDAVLDLTELLAPIEGTPVAAEELYAGPVGKAFRDIADARSSARSNERDALKLDGNDADKAVQAANSAWAFVRANAPDFIAEKAKDLEVAAYLVEALVRSDGFAGLSEGINLIAGLIDRYWDDGLLPAPDGDDESERLAAMVGLNGDDGPGSLFEPIKRVEITEHSDPGPFAYWNYEQALALNRVADEKVRNARIEKGEASIDQIKTSAAQSPAEFLIETIQTVQSALAAFARMEDSARARVGDAAPSASTNVALLENIAGCLRVIVPQTILDRLLPATADETPPATNADAPEQGQAVAETPTAKIALAPSGAIDSREAAIKQLLRVAEFFRQNEPHSPVSLSLQELVRRANLPLQLLLEELIPDQDARRNFFLRAGIHPESISSASDSSSDN